MLHVDYVLSRDINMIRVSLELASVRSATPYRADFCLSTGTLDTS